MKLHIIYNSNNCRRVTATIKQLGLDVEIIERHVGDAKTPEYLALNPQGKVPTLVDGDFTLWESRAIMQYVASKKPGNTLWPTDLQKQADIARWQFWEATHLAPATGPFTFERLFKKVFMKQEPDEVVLAAAEKAFHQAAPVLNAHLETRKFVTGDDLTLADFSIGGSFSFAEVAGMPWDKYTHIKAWWGRLNELPAWKNTAPKLG